MIILRKLNVGFDICALIIVILHESSHVLRRYMVQPKVYLDTEEMNKSFLENQINGIDVFNFDEPINENNLLNEGGNMLEFLLFGNVLEDFIEEEEHFILNIENWSKDLKTFRDSYLNLRKNKKKPFKTSRRFMETDSKPRLEREYFCGNQRHKKYEN
jgi:hypothetical protein